MKRLTSERAFSNVVDIDIVCITDLPRVPSQCDRHATRATWKSSSFRTFFDSLAWRAASSNTLSFLSFSFFFFCIFRIGHPPQTSRCRLVKMRRSGGFESPSGQSKFFLFSFSVYRTPGKTVAAQAHYPIVWTRNWCIDFIFVFWWEKGRVATHEQNQQIERLVRVSTTTISQSLLWFIYLLLLLLLLLFIFFFFARERKRTVAFAH